MSDYLLKPVEFHRYDGNNYWPCDFGDDECPNDVAWWTDTSWVVPLYACDEHKKEYDQ